MYSRGRKCRTVSPRKPLLTGRLAVSLGLVAALGLALGRTGQPSHDRDEASLAAVSGPRSDVLGSFNSITDAVSNTYDRNTKKRTNRPVKAPATDLRWQEQRSGLGFGAPPPKYSPFGNIFEPEDDEPPPRVAAPSPPVGYRTVCVRLCDGAYFPVSVSTYSDRFGKDAETCQKSCSSPSRLYVYENPGGTPETMKDLDGHPYSDLATAFLFRTAYNPDCTCKPQPWTEAAAARHRGYAFAALAKAGDPQAEAQVGSVETAMAEAEAAERRLQGAADTIATEPRRAVRAAPLTASSGISRSSAGSPTDPRYGFWGRPRYAQSESRATPEARRQGRLKRAPSRGFGSDD